MNPSLRERAKRKGDLRCSILEILRLDLGGIAESGAQLARLTCTTRAAVRKALDALVLEGAIEIAGKSRKRAGAVRLLSPASSSTVAGAASQSAGA